MEYCSYFSINDYILISHMGGVNYKVMSLFNEGHREHKITQRNGYEFTRIVYETSI